MKKETLFLIALVVGLGGYQLWQKNQQKKQLKQPKQSIFSILKLIEAESKETSEAIKKVAEVFKIAEKDANATYELYLQNKQLTAEAFDEVLKKNGLME